MGATFGSLAFTHPFAAAFFVVLGCIAVAAVAALLEKVTMIPSPLSAMLDRYVPGLVAILTFILLAYTVAHLYR
jgi:predicted membrane channel-forming protein YqfA (hemolysin III family)